MNAALGSALWSRNEKPITEKVVSTWGMPTCFLDLGRCRACPRDRGSVRQLHQHEERALVFLRQKAGGRADREPVGRPPEADDGDDRQLQRCGEAAPRHRHAVANKIDALEDAAL